MSITLPPKETKALAPIPIPTTIQVLWAFDHSFGLITISPSRMAMRAREVMPSDLR